MPSSNPRYRNWKRRESVRAYILATQDVCGICGQPVDKTLGKVPKEGGGYAWHPMSPVIDEIVPISKGGSPYDRGNCQLAHRSCNAHKGAKVGRRAPNSEDPRHKLGRGGVKTSREW